MKKMFNEGNQIHNFLSSSGSGTVINYGSGSDFLTSYGSGYGSGFTSQKVTVPTVSVPVPVPQHWYPGTYPLVHARVQIEKGGGFLSRLYLPIRYKGFLFSCTQGGWAGWKLRVTVEYDCLMQCLLRFCMAGSCALPMAQ